MSSPLIAKSISTSGSTPNKSFIIPKKHQKSSQDVLNRTKQESLINHSFNDYMQRNSPMIGAHSIEDFKITIDLSPVTDIILQDELVNDFRSDFIQQPQFL